MNLVFIIQNLTGMGLFSLIGPIFLMWALLLPVWQEKEKEEKNRWKEEKKDYDFIFFMKSMSVPHSYLYWELLESNN